MKNSKSQNPDRRSFIKLSTLAGGGLTYRGDANFNGSDTLTITTGDATATAPITVPATALRAPASAAALAAVCPPMLSSA